MVLYPPTNSMMQWDEPFMTQPGLVQRCLFVLLISAESVSTGIYSFDSVFLSSPLSGCLALYAYGGRVDMSLCIKSQVRDLSGPVPRPQSATISQMSLSSTLSASVPSTQRSWRVCPSDLLMLHSLYSLLGAIGLIMYPTMMQ